ncbi:MAG: MATE family efflux transporter [Lachnospiraceae bacterium]|nr:MATE family efflux transporter [Lachnospiraceae bacterium]
MEEKKTLTKDMTVGKPMALIWRFSVPLLMGNIFQQMYNLIDTAIVGKFLGISALSSVGSTGAVMFLILGLCLGMCSGFAIPIAQKFGAKAYSEMRNYVMNATYIAIVMAVVITLFTTLLCKNILTWMGTPEDIFDGAYSYLFVILAGIPFTILYNFLSAVIRALGDSKTPFYFLVISTVLNIVLDVTFIVVFGLGVSGAALATIVAQAVSGIACFIYMRMNFDILKLEPYEKDPDGHKIKVLLSMGLPMGLQFSITAIGTVMLQAAVNGLGSAYVAAYTAVGKIKQLAMCPYDAFANGSATFCSQNLGAKKLDRIGEGVKAAITISLIYSVFIAIVLFFGGRYLALIFVDASEVSVLNDISLYLKCASVFYLVLAILNVVRMTIQGLGYSGLSMLAGLSELFARGLMSLFVIPTVGYLAVCFTDQIAWVAAAITVSFLYRYVMKKIRERFNDKT